jgi:hypothetical protein
VLTLPLLVAILAATPTASALTLTLSATETPYPGVTLKQYRTSSPTTDVWVAEVNLCAAQIHVDATRAPDATQSTGGWGGDWEVSVAMNADFYRTSPVRVYGDAVGAGVRWPSLQTGTDSSYSAEWYYRDYGWFAFGPDRVDYTHTKWVKDNAASFGGALGGFAPTTVAPTPPNDTIALVSGFPALVVEGAPISCSSPTASSCFPDRSDMRDRHPRSAIGLTADQQTLLLVVVDGRTSRASGMYGAELADLMHQLGAWQALNVDGGGSTQLWLADRGYVNNVSGNNSGAGTRSVANHIGVYTDGGPARGARAGHCETAPVCQLIGPGGDVLDDAGACFQGFGGPAYWRTESGGHGGSFRWTNAFNSTSPDNWSWFRVHLEEAGEYLVEWHGIAEYAIFDEVRTVVRAAGTDHTTTLDMGGRDGWQALGTYTFAAGGDQYVAFYDDHAGSVPSNQHIISDAVRLTRVGPWCGDGACDAAEGCAACPGDCTGPEEVPANGVDDDCDGVIDERLRPDDSGGPLPDSGGGGADSTTDEGSGAEGTGAGTDAGGDAAADGGTSSSDEGGAAGDAGDASAAQDTGSTGSGGKGLRIGAPDGGCGGVGLSLALPALVLPLLRRRRSGASPR